ncbi:YdcF family protein [Clostridium lundense]|uniref:YdcF family protein n=1 Tax=Clostridium lundense TaxID=319475 RepID=UPI00055564C2|nr:YdcF family protein [Clostridium lundense]
MKVLGKVIISIFSLGVILTLTLGVSIYNFGKNSKGEKSDCIIVLGCSVYGENPSPFLQWRTEEGYRLFKEGYADFIIVSGGKGPGESISEAEAMKRYLLKKGVKEEFIIKEDQSKTTMENLINSKRIMEKKGFNKSIIVSNKYHLKRASLMAKKVGIDASFSGVYVSDYKSHERMGFIREIPGLLKFYITGR